MATVVTSVCFTATVVAENKQEKDNEPKDSIVTVEDATITVAAAVVTK